jgi:hypothetical protein
LARIQSTQKPITLDTVRLLLPHCRHVPNRYGNIPLPIPVMGLSHKKNCILLEQWSVGVLE